MEDRFEDLKMNEDYMMDMFSSIAIKVDPLAEYLEFMFTEKQSKSAAGCKSDDKNILPYDKLRAELFYLSRIDFWQTDGIVSCLGEEAVRTFLIEFWDTSKVTSAYLSSFGGKFSKSQLSDQDKMTGINKDSSSFTLESSHASSTYSLKTSETIWINNAAGKDQTYANNDFGWGHEAKVTVRAGIGGKFGRCFSYMTLLTSWIAGHNYNCCQTWCTKDQKIAWCSIGCTKSYPPEKRTDCTQEENWYHTRGVQCYNGGLGAVAFSSLLNYC